MEIYLSKAQFTLAISKFNSHWQHQNPIFIDNIKSQFSLAISKAQFPLAISKTQFSLHYFIKKGAQDYQRLEKKKHHGKILP